MRQQEFRMPATGEGWRHYKGGLYTVVGMAQERKERVEPTKTDRGAAIAILGVLGFFLVLGVILHVIYSRAGRPRR